MDTQTIALRQDRLVLSQCRICRSRKVKFLIEFDERMSDGTRRKFFICKKCGTILDERGIAPDYEDGVPGTDVESFVKYSYEAGCCIHFNALSVCLAREALGDLRRENQARFLDIGSGLGFSLIFAKKMGFSPIGVEPSPLNGIAQSTLGVEAIPDYLEKADLPKKSFDIVHASEVIEHVQDPRAFAGYAASLLKDSGILVLTTPNAEVAARGEKSKEKEWFEAYVPGHHLNILTSKALTNILRDQGFNDIRVLALDGSSGKKRLMTVSSLKERVIMPLPSIDSLRSQARLLTDALLEELIAQKKSGQFNEWLYQGALFRLFEEYANRGDFEKAVKIELQLDALLASTGFKEESLEQVLCDTYEAYVSQVVAFVGMYMYLKGMLALNHKRDFGMARRKFEIAEHLFRVERSVRCYNPSRYEWPERARFCQGLAYLYAGLREEALLVFDEILKLRHGQLTPALRRQIYANKGVAHLQKYDNVKAIEAFLRQIIIKPLPFRENREAIKNMRIAILQIVRDFFDR